MDIDVIRRLRIMIVLPLLSAMLGLSLVNCEPYRSGGVQDLMNAIPLDGANSSSVFVFQNQPGDFDPNFAVHRPVIRNRKKLALKLAKFEQRLKSKGFIFRKENPEASANYPQEVEIDNRLDKGRNGESTTNFKPESISPVDWQPKTKRKKKKKKFRKNLMLLKLAKTNDVSGDVMGGGSALPAYAFNGLNAAESRKLVEFQQAQEPLARMLNNRKKSLMQTSFNEVGKSKQKPVKNGPTLTSCRNEAVLLCGKGAMRSLRKVARNNEGRVLYAQKCGIRDKFFSCVKGMADTDMCQQKVRSIFGLRKQLLKVRNVLWTTRGCVIGIDEL